MSINQRIQKKSLKYFYMYKSHLLSTSMIVWSLGVKTDQFCPQQDGEGVLDHKVLYFSAIGALTSLANITLPDIAFSINLLGIYNSTPT